MKTYDVFISHASEDKGTVAVPLADYLTGAGFKVWLDALELRIGDSLRERIDQGLSQCQFGVVILSPNFFRKEWPKRDMNALFAIEEDGSKVILPVWHQVTQKEVKAFSPIIADRLAANTEEGVEAVARSIISVVQQRGIRATLARLLDEGPSPERLSEFLAERPEILGHALGRYSMYGPFQVTQKPGLPPFHMTCHSMTGSDGSCRCSYVSFQAASTTAATDEGLDNVLKAASDAISRPLRDGTCPVDRRPLRSTFGLGTVFYGRRDRVSAQARETMQGYAEHLGLLVHSYDRLLEASADRR